MEQQAINFSFSYQASQALSLYQSTQEGSKGAKGAMPMGNAPCCPPSQVPPGMEKAFGTDLFESHGKSSPLGAETVMAVLEEKVNLKIEASFKGEATEQEDPMDYWSPERTAERIVGFATKFFDNFAEASGGESEEVLNEFLDIIKGAIEEGIGQAVDTLGEMGEYGEKNESTISDTSDHIFRMLDDFRSKVLARLNGGAEEEKENENGSGLEIEIEAEQSETLLLAA